MYKDVKAFYKDTYDVLMGHEVQNLIALGNLIIGNEGKDKSYWRDPANWLMATVTDGGIVLTAIMTPPFNITLYATDNKENPAAIACLVEGLLSAKIPIPGVMTTCSLAESFTKIYTKATGQSHKIVTNLRIYELLQVNPEIQMLGKLRLFQESDMSFFPFWVECAMKDFHGTPVVIGADADAYKYRINKKNHYVLEHNGLAVSMACINREMQTVSGVGMVYTPPYFRGKGYASSCVAQLSQLILDKGFTRCALYTDLANPTSNSIYQKIGYNPIGDSLEIKFEEV